MQKLPKEDFVLDATCKTYKRPVYNGLIDPNLSSFFGSPRRRKLLMAQKLILPNGQINAKECQKQITSLCQTSNPFKKSTVSETTINKLPQKSSSHSSNATKTHKCSKKTEQSRLPPITSSEFKEIIQKRRELLTDL